MRSTIFPAASWTTFTVKVVHHRTISSLQAVREVVWGSRDDSVLGFCFHDEMVMRETGILAAIHLAEGAASTPIIAHEALHAGLVVARCLRINLEDTQGEELLADVVETVVAGTLRFLAGLKAGKRPSSKHPPNCGPTPEKKAPGAKGKATLQQLGS